MSMNNRSYVGTGTVNGGVYPSFAGRFQSARPLQRLQIHFRHILGFKGLVIQSRRRSEHIFVVYPYRRVTPGPLHEVVV